MTTLSYRFKWSILLFSLLIGIHSGQSLGKLRQATRFNTITGVVDSTHLIRATCLGRLNAHLCQRHKNVQACFLYIRCMLLFEFEFELE